MLSVLRDETAPPARRDEMAKAAAPFVHPKLATTKVQGDRDAPLFDLSQLTDSELAFLRRTILKATPVDAAVSDKMLKYSKSGRFLGFVRPRPVKTAPFARRREAQALNSRTMPELRPGSRDVDSGYAADRAMDRSDNRSPSSIRGSNRILDKMSNPDTDYADDRALDRLILIESWEAEKDGDQLAGSVLRKATRTIGACRDDKLC
jgi:hypothetical protein